MEVFSVPSTFEFNKSDTAASKVKYGDFMADSAQSMIDGFVCTRSPTAVGTLVILAWSGSMKSAILQLKIDGLNHYDNNKMNIFIHN